MTTTQRLERQLSVTLDDHHGGNVLEQRRKAHALCEQIYRSLPRVHRWSFLTKPSVTKNGGKI